MPDSSRIMVFRNGMWNGSKVWMPAGGHIGVGSAGDVLGEEREVEERPEEADEEHHLGGDEQRHAVAQAEPHHRAVQAGRAALAQHRRATT